MKAIELIEKKRDGGEHTAEEIASLVNAYVRGDVRDYQIAGWLMAGHRSVDYWRTVIFTVLTMSQMGNALSCRSNLPLWYRRWGQNLWLPAAVLLTLVLQVAVVYLPPLQTVFHTTSIELKDFLLCLAISLGVLVVIELIKLLPTASVRIRPDAEREIADHGDSGRPADG